MTTYTARWVFPVAGPPLPHGTLSVEGERIVAVEPAGVVRPTHDLGQVALLPGLVNAHTHLDLSALRGQVPPTPDLPAWLRQVVVQRGQMAPHTEAESVTAGLAECLRFGTTLLGDISGTGASWAALTNAPVRAVVFREWLGLTADRARVAQDQADEWLTTHAPTATCRAGLSPHAPYSVRADSFNAAAARARTHATHLAVHWAESAAEGELLTAHAGPFGAFLQQLGVYDPTGLAASWPDVLARCAAAPTLFVHANYAATDWPMPPGASVVVCPRTHRAFDHPRHPFAELRANGVTVALGTDSLASNPDLNLWAEVRCLAHTRPDVAPAELLRMATLSGAEALGWADQTGSLAPGKSADAVTISLSATEVADPHEWLLTSAACVAATLFRGQWRDALDSWTERKNTSD
jgi:cytosine/adenosine deaminase-related metal-dependent hydrolase